MKKFRFCLLLSLPLILFFSPARAMKEEDFQKFTVNLAIFVQAVYEFFENSPHYAAILQNPEAIEIGKLKGAREILPRLKADVAKGSIDAYNNLSLLTSLSTIVAFALKIFEDATIHVSDDLKSVSDFLAGESAKGLLNTHNLRRRLPRGALQKSPPLTYCFVGMEELGKMASELVYGLDISDLAYLQTNVPEQFSMILLIEQFLMPYIVAYEFPKYKDIPQPTSVVILMAKLRLIQCLKSVTDTTSLAISTRSTSNPYVCDDDVINPATAAEPKHTQVQQTLEIQAAPHFCPDCVECRLRAKLQKRAAKAAANEKKKS